MTGLLVSVRDASEAESALAGGARLVDVKEPSRGALGAADPSVWRSVARVVGATPWSAALGELLDWDPSFAVRLSEPSVLRTLAPRLGQHLPPASFAKVGLAGCGRTRSWPARWSRFCGRLPPGVAAVGVVYADWKTAEAPAPEQVVDTAQALGCAAVLIDTYDKRGGDLFSHLTTDDLDRLAGRIRSANLRLVLAGSLNRQSIPRTLRWQPDWIAVRGAACRGGRLDRVSADRVAQLARTVEGQTMRLAVEERGERIDAPGRCMKPEA